MPHYDLEQIFLTVLTFCVLFGVFGGLRGAWYAFISIGMIVIFIGWLQFINFSGNWPADQPYIEHYTPSELEKTRVDQIFERIGGSDTQNIRDYQRCIEHHVCLRAFHPSLPTR